MERVIMEQTFDPPISEEQMSKMARRIDDCLQLRNGAWARSYVARDRSRMVCEFVAPDAESVREALRSGNIPFVRVWSSEVFDAADYPEHLERLNRVRGDARR
jgi:Nickel responsive protein SCO4226-like